MICVDASVAAKWLLAEDYSGIARNLFRESVTAAEPIVAPPLLPFEVANILRQRMRRPAPLSRDQAIALLNEFLAFPVEIHVPRSLHQQALILADTYQLPAVYDAHYVALAQSVGCDLWTADHRLHNALRDHLPFVKWIGDYTACKAS